MEKCELPLDIQEIHETIAAESSLISHTNKMQDFILCKDWIEDDEKSQMYVTMRREWVTIANIYKHKRQECEEKLLSIIRSESTDEGLLRYASFMYDQLTSKESKFEQLLRRIDAKLV